MVPLVGVDAVPEETSLAAAIETVRREGFSRIPVFRRRITDIVGVVHVFDLLQAPDLSRPVSDIMRPVSYFPESMPLDEALVAMQRTGENLSVIVDEYGGSAGILTLEDLIEEIVGDIEDEHDLGEELARVVSPRMLSVIGRAPIMELNDRFGLKLSEADEYATIGGLVVERLGHIPKPGEKLIEGDLTITVTRSDARAVRELMLTLRIRSAPSSSSGDDRKANSRNPRRRRRGQDDCLCGVQTHRPAAIRGSWIRQTRQSQKRPARNSRSGFRRRQNCGSARGDRTARARVRNESDYHAARREQGAYRQTENSQAGLSCGRSHRRRRQGAREAVGAGRCDGDECGHFRHSGRRGSGAVAPSCSEIAWRESTTSASRGFIG